MTKYIMIFLMFFAYVFGDCSISDIVEGVGTDKDDAIKDACKNAIEKNLGVFISAETLVKSNQLISQEILAYSRGYIESFDIISEQKEDKLYKVKLIVQIKNEELLSKLGRLNVIDINGELLAINAKLDLERKQNAVEIINQLMKENYKKGYEIKISEPKIETNLDTKTATIQLDVEIRQNQEMVNIIWNIIKKLSIKEDKTRGQFSIYFSSEVVDNRRIGEFIFVDKEVFFVYGESSFISGFNLNIYDSERALLGNSSIHFSVSNNAIKWSYDTFTISFIGNCSLDTIKKIKKIEANISKFEINEKYDPYLYQPNFSRFGESSKPLENEMNRRRATVIEFKEEEK